MYDKYAQLYGWTPREVDELDWDEYYWLPIVREAKNEAAEQIARLDAQK